MGSSRLLSLVAFLPIVIGGVALEAMLTLGCQSTLGCRGTVARPELANGAVATLPSPFVASTFALLVLLGVSYASQRRQTARPWPASNAATKTPERSITDVVAAYLNLTKPRIIVLLLITTLAGMIIAQRGLPPWGLILATMVGGAFAAGGANAINCYIDRDIDLLMHRTQKRALPRGRVAPRQALLFGLVLGGLSFILLAIFANLLTAVLALSGLLFYVLIYTGILKRSTPQNIVIGGAAGAMPPMVGWAAVTGRVDLPALYLFAVIFFWTPTHFWALSLLTSQDYARANVPMLPLVMGEGETRRQILLYSILLVAVTTLLVCGRAMGLFYLAAALILGAGLIYYAIRLLRDGTRQRARQLFVYSNLYLALLFLAMALDRAVISIS